MEESVGWSRSTPPSDVDGQGFLVELAGKLTRREERFRDQGFVQAQAAIKRAAEAGGVPSSGQYPWSKSYPHPARADGRRVDIEVNAGKAFVAAIQAIQVGEE